MDIKVQCSGFKVYGSWFGVYIMEIALIFARFIRSL